MTIPIACTACDMFNLTSASRGGPQRVMKEKTAISSVEIPRPTIKLETMKNG